MRRLVFALATVWLCSFGCGDSSTRFESIPAQPSFSRHIIPILAKNCAGCHDDSQKMIPRMDRGACRSWLGLTTATLGAPPCTQTLYQRIRGYVCQCKDDPYLKYIEPGNTDPKKSYLMAKIMASYDPATYDNSQYLCHITHPQLGTFLSAPMPPRARMSYIEVETVRKWVEQGAEDN